MPRQQTLQATIDWSYELLTEPERVFFRRLAVFAGGISPGASRSRSGRKQRSWDRGRSSGSRRYEPSGRTCARRSVAEVMAVAREDGHEFVLSQCVCALGIAGIQRGDPARAVRLIAASAGIHSLTPVYTNQHVDYETSLDAARVALGGETFAQFWAEGQAMTLEEAVAYALSDDEPGQAEERPTRQS